MYLGSCPGVKRLLEREAYLPPPPNAEVKNGWSYTSIPLVNTFLPWAGQLHLSTAAPWLKHHAVKMYEEVEVKFHKFFLILVLYGSQRPTSHSVGGEGGRPGGPYSRSRSWGVQSVWPLPAIELRSSVRPARSPATTKTETTQHIGSNEQVSV